MPSLQIPEFASSIPPMTSDEILNHARTVYDGLPDPVKGALDHAHGLLGGAPGSSVADAVAPPPVSASKIGPIDMPDIADTASVPESASTATTGAMPPIESVAGSSVDPALIGREPDTFAPMDTGPMPPMSANRGELARLTRPPLMSGDPDAHTERDTGRPGFDQIKNPLLRGLATAGDVVLSGILPNFGRFIPGTTAYHDERVGDASGAVNREQATAKGDADVAHTQAQSHLAEAQAAGLPAESKLHEAQAANYLSEVEARKNPDLDELAEPVKDPNDPSGVPRIAWTDKRGKPGNVIYGPPAAARPAAHVQTDPKELYTDAIADAFKRGVDPAKDPKVQQLAAAITDIQRQPITKEPQRDDKYIAIQAKPADQRTDEENAYVKGYEKYVHETKVQPGVVRMETMGSLREIPVLDTKNGNSPVFLSATEINAANQKEPGRYMPPGVGTPALSKTALIEDIRSNVQQVRESLNAMPELSVGDRTRIALAMRSRDPKSAISALVSSGAIPDDPHLQDYLINLTNLHENAMAMRSVLGAGQGSEDLRSAITAVVPGPQTPNKAYGLKQLDVFEKTLDRLEKGIPKVTLRDGGGATTHYVDNGQDYDIPADKVKAFESKHPNAKKQ